jgi:hypothetical protein
VRLVLGGTELNWNIPTTGAEVVVEVPPTLDDPAEQMRQQLSSDWKPLELRHDPGKNLLLVPRWSLPAWKMAGHQASDGSGALALTVIDRLLDTPEPILPPFIVEYILARLQKAFPTTLSEARAARGQRLGADLAALVRAGHGLNRLEHDLTVMAGLPELSSSELASLLKKREEVRPLIRGPWVAPRKGGRARPSLSGKPPAADAGSVPEPYRQAANWLPPVRPTVRVRLGRELSERWLPGSQQSDDLKGALNDLRTELYGRLGVKVGRIDVVTDTVLPPNVAATELAKDEAGGLARTMAFPSGAVASSLTAPLLKCLTTHRQDLVTPEQVAAEMNGLPSAVRAWLADRYSTTDLRGVLRSVVGPAGAEASLRHIPWLLQSLVFWSQVTPGPASTADLAQHLRALQSARLAGAAPAPGQGDRAASFTARGIEALAREQPHEAASAFATALRADRARAVSSFIAGYGSGVRSAMAGRLEQLCNGEERVSLTDEQYAELNDLVRQTEPSSQAALEMQACRLVASSQRAGRLRRLDFAREVLLPAPRATALRPAQGARLAREVASIVDPVRGDRRLRAAAGDLLVSAFPSLSWEAQDDIWQRLWKECEAAGPNRWRCDLLERIHQAAPVAYRALGLALYHVDIGSPAALGRVADLLSQADGLFAKEGPSVQAALADQAQYLRITTKLRQDQPRMTFSREDSAGLRRLIDSSDEVLAQMAYHSLTSLHAIAGEHDEADRLSTVAFKKWPNLAGFPLLQLFGKLQSGDVDAASDLAAFLRKTASGPGLPADERLEFIAGATLGEILTRSGEWALTGRAFLDSEHRWVPYVALLLTSSIAVDGRQAEGRQLLESRWRRVDRTTWAARLEEGDAVAWAEMLIGYFLDQVPRADIFGPLADDGTLATSPLRHLPVSRAGLSCEAHFYEAMKANSRGDQATARIGFERVLATGAWHFQEYWIAKHLLGLNGAGPRPATSEITTANRRSTTR